MDSMPSLVLNEIASYLNDHDLRNFCHIQSLDEDFYRSRIVDRYGQNILNLITNSSKEWYTSEEGQLLGKFHEKKIHPTTELHGRIIMEKKFLRAFRYMLNLNSILRRSFECLMGDETINDTDEHVSSFISLMLEFR